MKKEPCKKFWGIWVRFLEIAKLQNFKFSVSDVIPANVQNIEPWFSLHFYVRFMEKKPPIKFYDVLVHFLRAYEVAKSWMIKLYLNVSDVIHANELTKYATVIMAYLENFGIFVDVTLIYDEKD